MLQRWNIVAPVTSYTAQGVNFNSVNSSTGTLVNLNCSSLQCVDNGHYSFSFWAKDITSTKRAKPVLWEHDPLGNSDPTVQINSTALNQGVQLSVLFNSLTTGYSEFPFVVDDGNWHHYLGSFNTNQPAGFKNGVLYVDDQIVGPDVFNDNGAGPDNNACDFKPLKFAFLGDNFSVADVWIAPGVQALIPSGGQFLNLISDTNRRIFTTILSGSLGSVLIPNDPATFPCAPVLFTGNSSIFGANFGVAVPKCSLNFWGGTFTKQNGTLADVTGPGGIPI